MTRKPDAEKRRGGEAVVDRVADRNSDQVALALESPRNPTLCQNREAHPAVERSLDKPDPVVYSCHDLRPIRPKSGSGSAKKKGSTRRASSRPATWITAPFPRSRSPSRRASPCPRMPRAKCPSPWSSDKARERLSGNELEKRSLGEGACPLRDCSFAPKVVSAGLRPPGRQE